MHYIRYSKLECRDLVELNSLRGIFSIVASSVAVSFVSYCSERIEGDRVLLTYEPMNKEEQKHFALHCYSSSLAKSMLSTNTCRPK
jgi:hypothetical protein